MSCPGAVERRGVEATIRCRALLPGIAQVKLYGQGMAVQRSLSRLYTCRTVPAPCCTPAVQTCCTPPYILLAEYKIYNIYKVRSTDRTDQRLGPRRPGTDNGCSGAAGSRRACSLLCNAVVGPAWRSSPSFTLLGVVGRSPVGVWHC